MKEESKMFFLSFIDVSLIPKKLDFSDPKVIKILEESKKAQEKILKLKKAPFINHQITI